MLPPAMLKESRQKSEGKATRKMGENLFSRNRAGSFREGSPAASGADRGLGLGRGHRGQAGGVRWDWGALAGRKRRPGAPDRACQLPSRVPHPLRLLLLPLQLWRIRLPSRVLGPDEHTPSEKLGRQLRALLSLGSVCGSGGLKHSPFSATSAATSCSSARTAAK